MNFPATMTQAQLDALSAEQRFSLFCQLADEPDDVADLSLFARLWGFDDVLPASAMPPEKDDVDHVGEP